MAVPPAPPAYYITHHNGQRPLVAVPHAGRLDLYAVAPTPPPCTPDGVVVRGFYDYTQCQTSVQQHRADASTIVYATAPTPARTFEPYDALHVGHDVDPDNVYIRNRRFGVGNSLLLLVGGADGWCYCIEGASMTRICRNRLRGTIEAYLSPIGNNDVPYPLLVTTTHLYSWCGGDVTEHTRPTDAASRQSLRTLARARSPCEVPVNERASVRALLGKYQCGGGGVRVEGVSRFAFSDWTSIPHQVQHPPRPPPDPPTTPWHAAG